jgi:hypothetical protein
MLTRQIALLCAIAILASLFLPWIVTPLGTNLAPWDALPAFEQSAVNEYLRGAPPETLAFLASFALAALFVVASIFGQEKRSLAFLTGLVPLVLAGMAIWRERERLGFAQLEGTMAEVNAMIAEASAVLGTGGWAWIGGAALLFLLGLFDPGRSKPRPITSSRW